MAMVSDCALVALANFSVVLVIGLGCARAPTLAALSVNARSSELGLK
jgi:altronate dehydratase